MHVSRKNQDKDVYSIGVGSGTGKIPVFATLRPQNLDLALQNRPDQTNTLCRSIHKTAWWLVIGLRRWPGALGRNGGWKCNTGVGSRVDATEADYGQETAAMYLTTASKSYPFTVD